MTTKSVLLRVLSLSLFALISSQLFGQEGMRLHYNKPATAWTEALPLGNGRLGAMVFGGVEREHLQFNEETLWAGKPHDYSHENASEYLDEIRLLLSNGKQLEAQKLAGRVFMSEPIGQKPYQPFGDLYLDFPGHENFSNYSRELDISKALSKVSYEIGDVKYERTVFSSFPDQALVLHLTGSQSKSLSFTLWLDALHEDKSITTEKDTQQLVVNVKDGALTGVASLKIVTDGVLEKKDGRLVVSEASMATVYLVAATNYVNFEDVSADPNERVAAYLSPLNSKKYEEILSSHLADYGNLYDRFSIDLGAKGKEQITTDVRIYDFWKQPEDPELVALYVQYARYLLISSSRPGTLPPTLQGIWNDNLTPPWLSGYTTNINLEMNYWHAEMANLAELQEPLFGMIADLSISGAKVAEKHYGADGWVAHHNVDIWRGAAPVNASHHGIWVTGGAWLTTHIWDHYRFSLNEDFLREYYPLMRDAALFFSEFLYEDQATGYLISSPSNSPEIGGLVAGPTMDHQIIRALFNQTIDAAKILATDEEFAAELTAMIPRIAPNQIGKHGQLQEWMEDKDDPEVHHRHVSHLWGMHPGNEINYEDTPELMEAAKQSLEFRGDNGTGWSLAWKINFWARFQDGNRSYKLLHSLLSPAEEPLRKNDGGSYPNLFDAHPPFQIDGNFGGAAGILEMIVQSHLDKIELLPALPDALPEGKIRGIRARGGFELDITWSNGQLTELIVYSKAGEDLKIQYQDAKVIIPTVKGGEYAFDGMLKSK
ncbi:glycoside hydrolase family 95 protein [Algoriphagus aquimarinus]|uniref:glycoside hydrolase family 95 protein n=1 Tax=Algoriphagus aquimarinus TaxID=237018 RepID=UPI0030DDAD48|tara:strand:+ start:198847 stop:201156 length:2310 start_codon:yes stop_codon:yes gene_type:complete